MIHRASDFHRVNYAGDSRVVRATWRLLLKTKGTHVCYVRVMKVYAWSSDKNETLIKERGISFEEIVLNIQIGNEVDIYDHPNQERYPGQKISIVIVEDYAYLVPYIETEGEIFLKTIIPSSKATREYVGGSDE